jgi:hypothetical protein
VLTRSGRNGIDFSIETNPQVVGCSVLSRLLIHDLLSDRNATEMVIASEDDLPIPSPSKEAARQGREKEESPGLTA